MESYNMNNGVDSGKPPLSYIDPDLFLTTTPGVELGSEYICVICTSVILDPIECKECSSLYCRGCLPTSDMVCPKKCGGS